jgi:hypothetical protein
MKLMTSPRTERQMALQKPRKRKTRRKSQVLLLARLMQLMKMMKSTTCPGTERQIALQKPRKKKTRKKNPVQLHH